MTNQKEIVCQLITLRQTVFWLGVNQDWWSGLSQIDLQRDYLNYVVPKTRLLAGFLLELEIARRFHDQAVGPGNYHLFRLSEDLERSIYQTFRQEAEQQAIIKTDTETLLGNLSRLTKDQTVEEQTGPLSLGSIQDIDDDTTRAVLARHYHFAFSAGYQVFPYLT